MHWDWVFKSYVYNKNPKSFTTNSMYFLRYKNSECTQNAYLLVFSQRGCLTSERVNKQKKDLSCSDVTHTY